MRVIILYGPTAVGKSAIAVELAKKINGEVISADSMQIYKHLNIGSAKITKDEMQGIPHHLIDILEPTENFSVADFCECCSKKIEEIALRGKTPIIVGGTGLYIKGLISGYSFGNVARNDILREELNNLSCNEIYSKLLEVNPKIIIDKNNKHRLIRTYERLSFGTENKNANNFLKYPYILFGICDDRQKIYERINLRVTKMVDMGLIDELKYLLSLNLNEDSLCMKAIGYKELLPYVNGEMSLEECLNVLRQKTRNYAKRQFTFMNQFKNIQKINFCGIEQTAKIIEEQIRYEN